MSEQKIAQPICKPFKELSSNEVRDVVEWLFWDQTCERKTIYTPRAWREMVCFDMAGMLKELAVIYFLNHTIIDSLSYEWVVAKESMRCLRDTGIFYHN